MGELLQLLVANLRPSDTSQGRLQRKQFGIRTRRTAKTSDDPSTVGIISSVHNAKSFGLDLALQEGNDSVETFRRTVGGNFVRFCCRCLLEKKMDSTGGIIFDLEGEECRRN